MDADRRHRRLRLRRRRPAVPGRLNMSTPAPITAPVTPASIVMVEAFLALVSRNGSLAGQDLRGLDLRGQDLRGRDLSSCALTGADLSGCALAGANLAGANLSGQDLS
ncbi:MAG: hypothetical protein EBT09_04235, partial [Actinobacteria bacterium]|nr:hypothetical protein [Actinomycetota bacterium]